MQTKYVSLYFQSDQIITEKDENRLKDHECADQCLMQEYQTGNRHLITKWDVEVKESTSTLLSSQKVYGLEISLH